MLLYEITERYRDLLSNLEIDEETGELLNAEELEIAEAEFAEKAESYALHIKNLRAEAEAIKAEAQALTERRKSIEQKTELLGDRLQAAMLATGKTKFETAKVALSFRKSETVNITDEDMIPVNLMREKVTYEPDKAEIKKRIKSGEDVPGASIEEKQNLQIK